MSLAVTRTEIAGAIGRLASKWRPRGFGGQMMIVGGGTAVVQLIGVAAAPILTRLYQPSDFGVIAAYSAIVEIIVVLSNLGYDFALTIVPDEKKATQLLIVSFVSSAVIGSLVLLSCIVLPEKVFLALSDDQRFFRYRWFLVAGVLGGAWYTILRGWATRTQSFGLLSLTRIYQGLGSVVVQVGLGLLELGIIGLVAGALVNLTAGVGMLSKKTWRDLKGADLRSLARGSWAAAKEERRYPTFTLWTAFLNLAGRSSPAIMMSAFFGPAATGLWGLGLRVLGTPSALVSSAVSSVFLSRVPEATKSQTLAKLMEDVTDRLSAISAYAFCSVAIFGPELFQLVFGEKWAQAGFYAQYLAPWLFLGFLFSPQTPVVMAKGRQAADAVWQIPMLALRLGSLYVGGLIGGVGLAVMLFGVTAAATAAAYFAWVIRVGGASFKTIGLRMLMDIVAVAAILLPGRLVYAMTGGSAWVMIGFLLIPAALLRRRLLAAWRP